MLWLEHKFQPPVKYNLADYTEFITNGSPIANTTEPTNGCESMLRPMTIEDMARASTKDVVDGYRKLHGGKSPTQLGKPMSDEELRKHYGL